MGLNFQFLPVTGSTPVGSVARDRWVVSVRVGGGYGGYVGLTIFVVCTVVT